jgi:hypothetical protein
MVLKPGRFGKSITSTWKVLKCGVVKGWEDQSDRSCDKLRSITKRQGGKKHPTYNKRRKANWIGHNLRSNCLVRHIIEGKIEGNVEATGRRGIRRKKL